MDDDSIEDTFKSVKEMMRSPKKHSLSQEEVLELTEDDIYDELDEDYIDPDENKSLAEKNSDVNELLTSMRNNDKDNHSCFVEDKKESGDSCVSKELAAKSAAHIRNLIRKMDVPSEKERLILNSNSLEALIFQSLKPYLDEWLEQNVANLIRKELESANSNKNKINF